MFSWNRCISGGDCGGVSNCCGVGIVASARLKVGIKAFLSLELCR